MRAALAALMVAGAPVAAQDMAFDAGPAEMCHDHACAGIAAALCMDRTEGGYSTVGMGTCLELERQAWDGRLNLAYGALRELYAASDAEEAGAPVPVPSRAEALRDAQRAWIAFRDDECALEAAQWGGGTGQGPASAECLVRLTAERALTIEGLADREARR